MEDREQRTKWDKRLFLQASAELLETGFLFELTVIINVRRSQCIIWANAEYARVILERGRQRVAHFGDDGYGVAGFGEFLSGGI
jgi:hypothetical protein